MSKRGTVILSTIRLLLGRPHVRHFELSGLRLTPVTTSFATLHRNFASSTNSTDDERNKLEKHKKETTASEVVRGGEQSKLEKGIKVVWEYPDDGKAVQKNYRALEFKHRPGDDLAIRAEKFTINQKHKKMMENYADYLKNIKNQEGKAKMNRKAKLADMKIAKQKKMNRIEMGNGKGKGKNRKTDNRLKLFNRMPWNIFKWNKPKDNATKIEQNNETQVKKFHSLIQKSKCQQKKN